MSTILTKEEFMQQYGFDPYVCSTSDQKSYDIYVKSGICPQKLTSKEQNNQGSMVYGAESDWQKFTHNLQDNLNIIIPVGLVLVLVLLIIYKNAKQIESFLKENVYQILFTLFSFALFTQIFQEYGQVQWIKVIAITGIVGILTAITKKILITKIVKK